jgi:hypothetical protein
MEYIKGENRDQLNYLSLEDSIEEQNPVRVIDAFVNAIDLIFFK